MNRNALTTILASSMALAGLTLTACEQTEPSDDHTDATGDGHTHGPGEDHDHEGESGDAGHEHDEGEPHDLGAATIGTLEVHATRYGDVAAGAETSVDISVTGEGGAQPAAVRIWIGTEDARGSLKALADAEGDHYHAHVQAPDPLPQGAALWIEVESAAGERSAGSFPLDG